MSSARQFEIQQVVGHGAFGTVYRANMTGADTLPCTVALKVLKDHARKNEELESRFRDEAQILALLDHPSIANTYGLVELEGRLVVIMQYVAGADLNRILSKFGRAPNKASAQLIHDICDALVHALNAKSPSGEPLQLLHRDIKPANLRLSDTGAVSILDFGVARANFSERQAKTQHLGFGSIGYLPNERIDGINVPKGDIYSLGAVFYELVSGERFGQTFLKESRHNTRMTQRLSKLKAANVPEEVLTLIREMMAFNHEERPTAEEARDRLEILIPKLDGAELSEWAQSVICKKTTYNSVPPDADWLGRTLYEDGLGPRTPPPVPSHRSRPLRAPAPPSKAPLVAAAASLGCLVALCIGIAIAIIAIMIAINLPI